ncbi:efflux RND transporter periplasmic adaptor subunit [Chitinophaga pendula]|uniref:efflux RND transporter periplasmic adaptor subunit n=1 Tax=Chitinophaga TaxID=79328 RepID=UPI000BB0B9B9|nr:MULTISPECIES: efflux RND transporter periplasmic adaptor subunit [Chitinophaga]ASZ13018.1 efflux transporter periplasmic adaptor subunit [Chitinophaga sp. MD30]UCJ09351.1 efflux RND transporter periplasmic adaptor subunit [Chitinophaga pendula]
MKRRYITIAIIAGIILLISWKLLSNKKQLNEKNKPVLNTNIRVPVSVTVVKSVPGNISFRKTGSLSPFKTVKVLATTSGLLLRLPFELGDAVQQGQTLALLDTRLLNIDLQKATTNITKLKNDLDTYTDLLKGHAATQEKVNEIRQQYLAELNQADRLRRQINDATIQSPLNGIIAAKAVEQGAYVNSGAELATVVNLSKVKAQVNLTETEVYKIKTGNHVSITADVYPDVTYDGNISFISPQADATHNYLVEVTITNTGRNMLRAGTFVNVDFVYSAGHDILVIPREALTESIQQASVYVVQQQQAVRRQVKTGLEMNGQIEIRNGLSAGDTVVTSGQINLKEGTAVNIAK